MNHGLPHHPPIISVKKPTLSSLPSSLFNPLVRLSFMTPAFVSFLPLRGLHRPTSLPLCHRSLRVRRLPMRAAKDDQDDSKEPHDIPQSAVDWNSEWEKFSASGMRSMAPKGREPVSKELLARQRAVNNVRKVTSKVPSRQQLFADWRFWLAIILALSIFTAFVQSTSTPPVASI